MSQHEKDPSQMGGVEVSYSDVIKERDYKIKRNSRSNQQDAPFGLAGSFGTSL
jgi:hypothetical protein